MIDPSLVLSFDDAHRNPMFYAAAFGKSDIIEFLLTLSKDIVLEPDIHGDTAIHAATSAGNADCLELLVKAAEGKVSSKVKFNEIVVFKSIAFNFA